MIGEATLAAEFAFEAIAPGWYGRTISPSWANKGGRIFGGYSAALSLGAVLQALPNTRLCSGHIAFLDPVMPGDISFEVTALKVGRSVAAMQVIGLQQGRRVLSAQAWLTATAAQSDAEPSMRGPNPEDARDLAWLSQFYTFHQWLESRGIDYPTGVEALCAGDGHRAVHVWARPKCRILSSASLAQLFDVVVADAFVGDTQLRQPDVDPDLLVSLDLSIQWSPLTGKAGWRRLEGWSPPTVDRVASCLGTIFDVDGNVCASVAQQTWTIARCSVDRTINQT